MTSEPFLQGISMPIHGLDHLLVTLSILLTLCVIALFASCHGSALIANESPVQNMPIFIAGCLFSALLLQGGGIALGLLLQRVLEIPVYRYAGLAMLMAAAVTSLFPSANDVVINLIEK
jgi:urease accessory protein